jgi:hypothetical protein
MQLLHLSCFCVSLRCAVNCTMLLLYSLCIRDADFVCHICCTLEIIARACCRNTAIDRIYSIANTVQTEQYWAAQDNSRKTS